MSGDESDAGVLDVSDEGSGLSSSSVAKSLFVDANLTGGVLVGEIDEITDEEMLVVGDGESSALEDADGSLLRETEGAALDELDGSALEESEGLELEEADGLVLVETRGDTLEDGFGVSWVAKSSPEPLPSAGIFGDVGGDGVGVFRKSI